MPRKTYKRKYAKRSRKTSFGRRRRTYRTSKSFTLTRDSTRDGTNQCHTVYAGTATGVSSVLSTTFQFSDMVGSGEVKSLFDNYKINSVKYRWCLSRDEDYTTANPGSYLRIVMCKDYNDQLVPGSSVQLRQYANSMEYVFRGEQSQSRWFTMKPASLQLFYLSSIANSTGPVWGRYIDTTQDTVPHYGLKFAFENFFTGAVLRLEVKINATFKGIS